MRHIIYVIAIFAGICALFGCKSSAEESAVAQTDSIELPSMVTRHVDMLISDSGVIRYKAITPVWYVYENNATNKYWYFPEGIHLDEIDSTFTSEFSIEADTAYNYETKQLWHLIKNVRVNSATGEYFETNDLFWDMKRHEVYSDSFIHIERPDAIIEGYGFISNDAFTVYELRRTSGIFPFDDRAAAQPRAARNDSTPRPDTKLRPAPPAPTVAPAAQPKNAAKADGQKPAADGQKPAAQPKKRPDINGMPSNPKTAKIRIVDE